MSASWCGLKTGLKRLAELSIFHSQPFSKKKKKKSSARLNALKISLLFSTVKKQAVRMNKCLINEISRFTVAKF